MELLKAEGYSVIQLEVNKFLAQQVPSHPGEYEDCVHQ